MKDSDTLILEIMTPELCRRYFSGFTADPDIFMDMSVFAPYVYSDERADRYFARQRDKARVFLAVMYNGEPRGEIIFKDIDNDRLECTLSISLQNDSFKNMGIGTAAERLALEYAFDKMKMNRVNADAVLKNTRSQHVLEKNGFRFVKQEDIFRYYTVSREDFEAIRERNMTDMDFLKLAESRYSVRKFDSRKVETEKIKAIVRAGRLAPTACNLQPQRVLVISGDEALEKFRRCTMSHYNAPLAILTCFDNNECWTRHYDGAKSGEVDCAIVTTHMMLEAASLGIGSTWVMHFIPEAVREEFSLPESFVPVSLLVMGYPAADAIPYPAHTSRKDEPETVFFDSYN